MTVISKDALINNRRQNLKLLTEHLGGAAVVARSCERSVQQISDMLAGRKTIGNRVSRMIEKSLELPDGFLDEIHEGGNVELAREGVTAVRKIPVLSFVQAGTPNSGDISYDEWIGVDADIPKNCFAVRVTGHSMEPLFCPNDLVIVDPDRSARPGDFVVARSELTFLGEATLKRYVVRGYTADGMEIFDLVPLNDNFPVFNSIEHRMVVLGVVIQMRKNF